MPSQFLPLLRNEIAKAQRRKLPWFGLFATGFLCFLAKFVASDLSTAAAVNAWGFVAFSMQVAKAAAGLLYLLLLSACVLLVAIALAKLRYDFRAVSDTMGIVSSRERMLREFLLGYALSLVPLAALVMYGLFISTIIRTPGAAVAVGISTLYLIDFTKHLVGLDPYIFTRYVGFSWVMLQQAAQGIDYQWQPEVWRMLALCGVSAVVTFTAGLGIFLRQDLNG
jgi:hypothetical protein